MGNGHSVPRMFIRLSDDTHVALMQLAIDERRDTRREAEHLIKVALKRRGLLKLVPRITEQDEAS